MTLVTLVIGVIVLFNTGQTVGKKIQIVNTADAAAYSAAVQQARAFNMISYMNRATIANQVAMAQMVSWYSWTNFAISATHNLKTALRVVGVVLTFFGVGVELQMVANALENVESGLKSGRDIEQTMFKAAAKAISILDGIYARTTQLLANVSSTDVINLASRVVQLNDPNAHIPPEGILILATNARTVNGYIQQYRIPKNGDRSAGADRLTNVVMEARDPFSRARNGNLLGVFHKRGGTDLVNYRNWVGVDTLNFTFSCPVWLCGTTGFPPHAVSFNVPLAWGGGAAVDKKPSSFKSLANKNNGWYGPYRGNGHEYAGQGHYRPYSDATQNGFSGWLALSRPAEGASDKAFIEPNSGAGSFLSNTLSSTVGLPDYVDIQKDKATIPYLNGKNASANGVNHLDVGPRFTVLVEESMNDIRTSSHIPGIGGAPDFDIQDKTVRNKMTALSSAEVYFSRPQTLFPNLVNSHREMGSLFSPYWHARLVETPCVTQIAVAATYGVVGVCIP
nr:hypothetical protein [Halothiobacillus diazotrophicus]